MTILDFESAVRSYRELRKNDVDQHEAVKQLFGTGIGRLELIKAVEVVDGLTTIESRKLVTKALAKNSR